jgi:SAM-dependent methyltransferase
MKASELKEIAGAFQKSRILLTAFELDVFTLIGKDSLKNETIAKSLNLDYNAVEKLLNALAAMNFLKKNDEHFSNSAAGLKYLSKDSPEYMVGLMHTNHLWDTWSGLTDVVKTGTAAKPEEINERGEKWLEAFIHAMHDRGKKQAPMQVTGIDLKNIESVLDVGGGSGCYSMEFLKRKPDLKAVVFDLPNVIPISKKIVNEEGYAGKITHQTGDYTKDELPRGFDLVFLSAIIHSNSYKTNEKLLTKCFRALNPGGKIIIQDWIMNDAKTEPLEGTVFAVNMLVSVAEGDCYSEMEVSTWLKNAGFTCFSITALNRGLSQMTAIKKT